MLRKTKGQATLEYAVIIGVIVAALAAMQIYIKRGFQARYHDGVQFLTTQTNEMGSNNQYEPYYLQSDYTNTHNNNGYTENIQARGSTVRTTANDSRITNSGGRQAYNDTSTAD